jgi:hypothetical protein
MESRLCTIPTERILLEDVGDPMETKSFWSRFTLVLEQFCVQKLCVEILCVRGGE